jgi:hypothetical protein
MVGKYHNTKRKENINGKLRSIYVKDKSDKEYIRYGSSRYVAIRNSRKQKGGARVYTEVEMSQVIASVAVFYFADRTEFYPYAKAFEDADKFKNLMTYNNVFRGTPEIIDSSSTTPATPMTDAKIMFEFKNALAVKAMKNNELLEDNSSYLKGYEGFMQQQVVSFCFDCSKDTNKEYILFTLYMIEEDTTETDKPILDHYTNNIKSILNIETEMLTNVKDVFIKLEVILKEKMTIYLANAIK